MSIDICADCERLVDTDDDCEAYIEIVAYGDDGATETICCCEWCRDRREALQDAEDEAAAHAQDVAEDLAEHGDRIDSAGGNMRASGGNS